jgi:hypothetical protein
MSLMMQSLSILCWQLEHVLFRTLSFSRGGDSQLVYDFLSCSSKSHLDTHRIFWKLLFGIVTFWETFSHTLISLYTWSSNTEHSHSYKLFFWEPYIYSKIEVLLIKLYYSHHVTKDASPTRAPQTTRIILTHRFCGASWRLFKTTTGQIVKSSQMCSLRYQTCKSAIMWISDTKCYPPASPK